MTSSALKKKQYRLQRKGRGKKLNNDSPSCLKDIYDQRKDGQKGVKN